jgi:hypothetical protein
MTDSISPLGTDRSARRPKLFYKSTCPPCCWMSRLAVILSFGIIRRLAISSAEAKTLYRQYPEHEGQLVLVHPHGVTFGRKVFAAVPLVVITGGWAITTHTLARLILPGSTLDSRDQGGER